MLPTLNRTAVVLRPKDPFLTWLQALLREADEPESGDGAVLEEPNVYLLPDADSRELAIEYLSDYAQILFEQELQGWTLDVRRWPKNREWEAFQEWFDFEILGLVLDATEDELALEEWGDA